MAVGASLGARPGSRRKDRGPVAAERGHRPQGVRISLPGLHGPSDAGLLRGSLGRCPPRGDGTAGCTWATRARHPRRASAARRLGVEARTFGSAITVTPDRCPNGPLVVWPNPAGPGGEMVHENWGMGNCNNAPYGGAPMIETVEDVACEIGVTKERCGCLTARRCSQYRMRLESRRAFSAARPRPGHGPARQGARDDRGGRGGDLLVRRVLAMALAGP